MLRIRRIAVNVFAEYRAEGLTQLHLSVKNFARAQACACWDDHDPSCQGARPKAIPLEC